MPHPAFAHWPALPAHAQAALLHRLEWLTTARPNQLPPTDTAWHTWLLLAGRGFGKTRAGAEEFAWQLLKNNGWRGAIIAPTAADARDTCVEGESGLISLLPPSCLSTWNRSQSEIILTNGSRIKLYSADAPERLRGPQHHVAWCDELAAWNSMDALDQLRFGLRLGQNPRTIITTTPRPIPTVHELLKQVNQGVALSSGHTFENAANLAPLALEQLRKRYEGTRLGRQELYAEVIDEIAGALWTHAQLDALRVSTLPALVRVVIAVDPAVTHGARADATGIVAAARGADGQAYVLRDATCTLSPDGWAQRVVQLYDELQADLVIGEVNQGGDLVETVLRTISPHLPFRGVHALRGKVLRAEPVAALYEQGRVHHYHTLPALEDQMCRFVPEPMTRSPDRVDALVWALNELMLNPTAPRVRNL